MPQTLATSLIAVIRPLGSINAANSPEFTKELTAAIVQNDGSTLLVDLERVDFLDSTGLMVLLSGLRLAERLGQRLALCSISPTVKIIFEITQLDRVFEIVESVEVLK